MAQELELSHLQQERYDIFLCTRGLPDALTGETAAIRQLMSALAGSGYRVFFPSALPKETPAEELAAAMADAVKTAKVMIAAAVGDEGAQDPTARLLWKSFRALAENDPERRFIACVRDLDELPEELRGAETLDIGELGFLAALRARLGEILPVRESLDEDESAGEEDESAEVGPEIPRRGRPFLILAIAFGVLVLLGLAVLILR